MSEEFEAPPISGDGVPVKELEPKKKVDEEKIKKLSEKKSRQFYILTAIVVFLVFIMGLGIGLLMQSKPAPSEILPTAKPTIKPSPEAASSSWKKDLREKTAGFENDLEKVDLKENQLLPPILDMEIRFELSP